MHVEVTIAMFARVLLTGNQWVREAVERWITRHYIRVVVVWIAFLLVLFATVKS